MPPGQGRDQESAVGVVPYLGLPEDRVFGAVAHVASHGQPHPPSHAIAVHGGDDRFFQPPNIQLTVLNIFKVIDLQGCEIFADAAIDGRIDQDALSLGGAPHMIPRAKRPPGPAEDHAENLRIFISFPKRLMEFLLKIRR